MKKILLVLIFICSYSQIFGTIWNNEEKNVGKKGKDIIKKWEGCERKVSKNHIVAYLCPANVATIGYGHTRGVSLGQSIDTIKAEEFLIEDAQRAVRIVKRKVNRHISQDMFDALVSFVFNIGHLSQNLLDEINAGYFELAAKRMNLYVNAGGKKLMGLVRRRADETNLFLKEFLKKYNR